MTQDHEDAKNLKNRNDDKSSGTAGAGRDPQEQKRQRSDAEMKNDKTLGNDQQQRKTSHSAEVDEDLDQETSPSSVVEERVDVGTKDWR